MTEAIKLLVADLGVKKRATSAHQHGQGTIVRTEAVQSSASVAPRTPLNSLYPSQTGRSDIDFLVEFEEPTFDNFMNLIDSLEALFRRKVEILTPEGVNSIRVKEMADSIRKSVVYV